MDMFHYFLIGIIFAFIAYSGVKDWQERRERRELYGRLMAKSLRDYNAEQQDHEKLMTRNPIKSAIEKQHKEQ